MSAELTIDVYTSPEFALPNGGIFSPTTSTLFLGPTEALLVDTQYLPEHVAEVERRIRESGRTLTTIFITHAHFDHYFGLSALLEAFPSARAIAVPSVAEVAASTLEGSREYARDFFAGAAIDNRAVPEAFAESSFKIDGVAVEIIELPQADVHPTSALHVPSLDAVVTGDCVYNGINPFLAESTIHEWPQWIESVNLIEALSPKIVVAGHKRPEANDDAAAIAETRRYLETFIDGYRAFTSTRDLVEHVRAHFPDYGNPSALLLSAATAMKYKKG